MYDVLELMIHQVPEMLNDVLTIIRDFSEQPWTPASLLGLASVCIVSPVLICTPPCVFGYYCLRYCCSRGCNRNIVVPASQTQIGEGENNDRAISRFFGKVFSEPKQLRSHDVVIKFFEEKPSEATLKKISSVITRQHSFFYRNKDECFIENKKRRNSVPDVMSETHKFKSD